MTRLTIALLVASTLAVSLAAQGGRAGRGQRPQRDIEPVPSGTGALAGRVTAADTGRPLKRARVIATGAGRPFSATTDEQGRFRLEALPAASYTVTATRTGFVDAVFGQRRPLAPGTPIALAEGQQVPEVNLRLIRGGVVAGRIVDEDGQPLAQAIVTVHRQQYVRGQKQLAVAGADRSDDRGEYRVFGLAPGDYFVSATAGGMERLAQQLIPRMFAEAEVAAAESTGYAATYYPGVITPADAGRVRVGPGQEVTGVEFQLQIVPLATVRGVVTGSGAPMVMLVAEGTAGGGGRGGRGGGPGGMAAAIGGALRGAQLRAAVRPDGSFVIPNVTPGQYTIIARAGDDSGAAAVQSLLVAGDVTVALTPTPGVDVGGTITLESGGGDVPRRFQGFRVTLRPIGAAASLPGSARPAPTDETGAFSIRGVLPGQYLVDAAAPQGWAMKTVYIDGADATDRAIDIKSTSLRGLNLIFTDRVSALSGTVRVEGDATAAGLTVIAFPADDALWFPESRHIRTTRANEGGAYRLNGLPPGDYLVVAVDDVEAGEWFDPVFLEQMKASAVKVRVGEGEQATRDLKVSATSPASRPF
jgi:protocatechuate 3,4-dioxygenase beta subunit